MSQPRSRILKRLLSATGYVAGASVVGSASLHLWTRKCYFEPFGPENDALFSHPMLKKTNPFNKPTSHDSCVRYIPYSDLNADLLQDAQRGGTKLIEAFSAGMWGGYGYAIQRKIMWFLSDESTRDHVWHKDELLRCKYEPGTFHTNHFHVLSKSPTSLIMRACFGPREDPPVPKDVDNMAQLQATLDDERQVVVLKLKTITLNGLETASNDPDPFGGVPGLLHKQYSKLLVESGADNCMR